MAEARGQIALHMPQRHQPPLLDLEQAARTRRFVSYAGHLGQQQWSEVKSWLTTEAEQPCDVIVLQELAGMPRPSSRPPADAAGALPNPLEPRRHCLPQQKARQLLERTGSIMVLLSPAVQAQGDPLEGTQLALSLRSDLTGMVVCCQDHGGCGLPTCLVASQDGSGQSSRPGNRAQVAEKVCQASTTSGHTASSRRFQQFSVSPA